jgi:hypothetical protein
MSNVFRENAAENSKRIVVLRDTPRGWLKQAEAEG